jgi:hypothetical protein
MLDARSAGLAGVGVAVDSQKAPFINPAVVATDAEEFDWSVLAPVNGKLEGDPNEMQDALRLFQQDYAGLSEADAQQRLDAIDQFTYRQMNSTAVAFVIPSAILGAAAFFNQREFNSARIRVGTVNLSTSSNPYDSYVEHRSLTIREIGVAMAKVLDVPGFILDGAMFGMNVKLGLLQSYGYDEPITSARVGLSENNIVDRTGSINFDIGVAKELGVWKLGVVVRDVFSFQREFGNSEEEYAVKPQIRAGFAYRSRLLLWEVDGDVSENAAVGHFPESKYLSVGLEYEALPGWRVRVGIRQNQRGEQETATTAGMGFHYGGFGLDMALLNSSEEQGIFSQLSFEF